MRSSLILLFAIALSGAADAALAQEGGEPATSEEHEYHRHHSASFLGASTHLDENDTGLTIGVEYARRFSRYWAVGAVVEMSSSKIERDIILLFPFIAYPVGGLSLLVAPALEFATVSVEHGGTTAEETELEFLLRFGVGYGFRVNETVGVGPLITADVTNGRWTLVYGVAFGFGF